MVPVACSIEITLGENAPKFDFSNINNPPHVNKVSVTNLLEFRSHTRVNFEVSYEI